jgi:hypothetical protein
VWLAALYLEVFAIVAAFRPRLHLVWGAGLILFHVGVLLAMGILFLEPPLLLLLLFVLSPFARGEPNAEATLESLPWLGPALSAAWASRVGWRRVEHARCFVDRRTTMGRCVFERLERIPLPAGHRVVEGDPPSEATRGARPFLTVLQELDGATVVRTNTRAWLWLLSRTGWRRTWAILLLLVPAAGLDAILHVYFALTTTRRAREALP